MQPTLRPHLDPAIPRGAHRCPRTKHQHLAPANVWRFNFSFPFRFSQGRFSKTARRRWPTGTGRKRGGPPAESNRSSLASSAATSGERLPPKNKRHQKNCIENRPALGSAVLLILPFRPLRNWALKVLGSSVGINNAPGQSSDGAYASSKQAALNSTRSRPACFAAYMAESAVRIEV